jgi:putative inorganic carbon (hco3(-)) transporter
VRDLALVFGTLVYLPISLRLPAAGVLCWVWFSIMNPHRQVYGFAYGQPINGLIAAATLFGWLVSRERKHWPKDATPWLMLALLGWMTLATPFAPFPEYSWVFWNRIVRLFVMIFMVYFLCTTKARIHGMIWILIISLGFYGVKGGVFTLLNGGFAIVYGPEDSVYQDNNQLALAVVTELPLVYYLAQQSRRWWLRLPAYIAMMLQVAMVFGSYSRGGVLALTMMLGILWLRSHRKVLYGAVAVVAVVGGLSVMPDSFWDRLHTLNDISADSSFEGRVMAWQVAFHYAVDHFPFGAGFYGAQTPSIFHSYFPGEDIHAAHSIYFQILGDHGFIGLALYLPILLLGLRNAGRIRRQVRGNPDLIWAYDLADMMRVSLLSFYFGGAALSMAYSDVYLVLIALLATLRERTQPATVTALEKVRAPRFPGAIRAPAPEPEPEPQAATRSGE